MQERTERQTLERLLADARRRLFFKSLQFNLILAAVVVLPVAAALVAASQRWYHAQGILPVVLGAIVVAFAFAGFKAWRQLGGKVSSALALDDQAQLKDRISSACEFAAQGELDEATRVQLHDALRHAESLDLKQVFRFQWPRFARLLPVACLLLALSFLVPPISAPASAKNGPLKAAQLEQLKDLQQELKEQAQKDPELQEVLKQLEKIHKQFEKGEISEREVMLQLGRLDENMRQKAQQMGVENLEAEMNTIIPHLASSAATLEAATALKENKMDKAAEELKKLSDKVKQDKLDKQQQRDLAMKLGVVGSKLGGKQNGSFGGDFAQASEALEKSDAKSFESACKSMCDKLGLMKKCQGMKSACNKLGLCKSCLGQCDSKELGFNVGLKQQGNKKGGLKAGTAASGDPYGDPNRLADSYKKMMKVSGEAGAGPVESETEVTDGQMSQSQVDLKQVHANYASVAEEVIEKEDIPLSHRYHVKRYFQSIRPQE
ncbi:MAG TPA: hypothetical protein VFR76_13970 [Verrucomicrobiae bacterium]|nr:hypothetical protein [Verrucomicrobiae bacterium]